MKLTKSIAVFLILSMLISLNACTAKTSEQNTSFKPAKILKPLLKR